jgi:gamma-butyrobetaine dioxygenase
VTTLEGLRELFSGDGARAYMGERVTLGEHMLQAAALAEQTGRPLALVAAALLHDIGHLAGASDERHGEAGDELLAGLFGEEVRRPVLLHVAAKRYLCTIEPGYRERLSAASTETLALQGGLMDAPERARFEAERYFAEALAVRRLDEEAKVPGRVTPPFSHYVGLLETLSLG